MKIQFVLFFIFGFLQLVFAQNKTEEEIIEEIIEEELEGFAAFGTLEIVSSVVVCVLIVIVAVVCGVLLYVKYQKQKKENPHMFQTNQTEDILVSKTVRNERTDEENQ